MNEREGEGEGRKGERKGEERETRGEEQIMIKAEGINENEWGRGTILREHYS